jgi:hypothetical protein
MTEMMTSSGAAILDGIRRLLECLVWDIGSSDFEFIWDLGFRISDFGRM